jgi:hypothetical protein
MAIKLSKKYGPFAGIFKQSRGARNPIGIGMSYWPPGYTTHTGRIGSLESILGPLKSFKIRALQTPAMKV